MKLEDLVIISGFSGAGKTTAMNVFEDAGYFCVDNLPAEMIRSLADLFTHPGSSVERAAVVSDLRGGTYFERLAEVLDELTAAGKAGKDQIREKVRARFPDLDKCIDSKEVQQRLDHILHFAVDNGLHVVTPQLFLGDNRVCDEDTDLGLTYALKQLAPKVIQ